MSLTYGPFSAPQLVVKTAGFYNQSGIVLYLVAFTDGTTVLIRTENAVQFADLKNGAVSQSFEIDGAKQFVACDLNGDGSFIAWGTQSEVRLVNMRSGMYLKHTLPAPVSCLNFGGSVSRLTVGTEEGLLYVFELNSEAGLELQSTNELPSIVGVHSGDLVKVTSRVSPEAPTNIRTSATDHAEWGSVTFSLSPESLSELGKAFVTLAHMGRSADIRVAFSQALIPLFLHYDDLGQLKVLSFDGVLASLSEDLKVQYSSLVATSEPASILKSPSGKYLCLITHDLVQLLSFDPLEVVLSLESPEERSEEDEAYKASLTAVQEFLDNMGVADQYSVVDAEGNQLDIQAKLDSLEAAAAVATFSPDDSLLALGWSDGTLEVYNLEGESADKIIGIQCSFTPIEDVALVPTAMGMLLMLLSEDQEVSLWNLDGQRLALDLGDLSGSVTALVYVHELEGVAFGASDGSVYFSKVQTGGTKSRCRN